MNMLIIFQAFLFQILGFENRLSKSIDCMIVFNLLHQDSKPTLEIIPKYTKRKGSTATLVLMYV